MSGVDYDKLLDDETKAFVAETLRFASTHTQPENIQQIRADYEALCLRFSGPDLDTIERDNQVIAGGKRPVPVRWYRHKDRSADQPAIIYFHGGGFVVGSLDSHDSICAEITDHTGLDVMAVDYALAPEWVFPAAIEDALQAVRYCLDEAPKRQFILAGDSAGGWLSAAVSHALNRPEPRLLGQVLIYPALGGNMTQKSYVDHAHAPLMSIQDLKWYFSQFFGDEQSVEMAGPLADSSFSDLPRTILFAADCDPLMDDSLSYAQRIQDAGGLCQCITQAGLVHGYLRGRHNVQKMADSFADIISALQHLAENNWPYR